jgi:thiaminase II
MSIYNNKKNLFFKLKQDAPKEWEQYTKHKFVIGLGDGTLKPSSFKDYLLQDYIFLQKFIKILTLSAYKAKNTEDRDRSIDFIIGIKHELGLHENYCKKFNISKNKLLKTKEKKQNKNYTDYVLKTGVQKSNLELFVALSPCIIGYGEIGYNLSKLKNWKKSKYASWIKMYASKEYQSISKENILYLDKLFTKANKNSYNSLIKIFKKASKLEINFWEMSL